jgi:NADH-quinone oxidoreductase subunit J
MLLRVDRVEDLSARHRLQRLVGVLLGFGILVGIGVTVVAELWPGPVGVKSLEEVTTQAGGNTQAVGEVLFNDYLLPFEITSVLLLAAIVGAVVLAKRTKEEK